MKKILVAGGTGDLGERIISELLKRNADVTMLVRTTSDVSKISGFEEQGVKVIKADLLNVDEVTKACKDIYCAVSALAGLRDVIVDTQTILLKAAVNAGVKRFIPSDYSLNFTKIPGGENRNFDLRRDFHAQLDKHDIAATSIYNGAFAEILGYNTPLLDFKKKTVGYWGEDPDWHLDFATMDNTAAYTAAAALDDTHPRFLNIASFQLSPNKICELAKEISGEAYQLVHMGSLEAFSAYNNSQREANPAGEKELYPKWQNGQYMHDMFSVHHDKLDNDRYDSIEWTDAKAFLTGILKRA
jgi:NAD(P)-dependent dehydrogenase (short-subunit alcohol dehydrogenase family)